MSQRSFLRLKITIIAIYMVYECLTDEPTGDENANYTTNMVFQSSKILTDEQTTDSHNEYETKYSNTGNATSPSVFDVTQYKKECPPHIGDSADIPCNSVTIIIHAALKKRRMDNRNVSRWPCNQEPKLWKEYVERIQEMSMKLCEKFQDVITAMISYSCLPSTILAQSAFDQSTIYNENYNFHFPDNITNPQLEKRKQEYIKSFDTVSKLKQALNLSEEVRVLYDKKSYEECKLKSLEKNKGGLNRKVYSEILNQKKLLNQHTESYSALVQKLTTYLKQYNLQNIFNSMEHAEMTITTEQDVDILERYVKPTFVVILLTVGLTGNLLLLSIFIKYKEMRTIANFMIINLTLTDCISLILNLPATFYWGTNYSHDKWACKTFHFSRKFSIIVSTYSIVMISLQRFLAVKSFPKAVVCKIGNKPKTFLIASSVWLYGFLYNIPIFVAPSIENHVCTDENHQILTVMVTLDFVFICILPSALIVVFSALAVSNIKVSALNVPGESIGQQQLKKDRIISAHVLTGLAVLFVISYFPYFIFQLIAGTYGVNKGQFTVNVIDTCVYYFLFTNSCFNPLALAIMSKNYRKYYMQLIGCIKTIPLDVVKGQSTMSTTETST